MANDSPRLAARRVNLQAVLKDPRVGGPTKLAQLLGKPNLRGHLTNIRDGKRGLGDELAAAIESALDLAPGWMDRQHLVAGERPPAYSLAQELSDPIGSHDLPLMPWEAIVHNKVPEIFRAVLPDDALSPEFPAGTEIVWTTRRRAAPGRLILVQDRHGLLHARQCHQGRGPGQWLAVPTHPAYVSFDGQEEGLRLVAVYKGRLEPDD